MPKYYGNMKNEHKNGIAAAFFFYIYFVEVDDEKGKRRA